MQITVMKNLNHKRATTTAMLQNMCFFLQYHTKLQHICFEKLHVGLACHLGGFNKKTNNMCLCYDDVRLKYYHHSRFSRAMLSA